MVGHTGILKRFGIVARGVATVIFLCVIAGWPLIAHDPAARLAGSCVLTFCFIAVVSAFGRSIATWAKWLVTLGTASMAIYLCHTVFAAGMREALLALNIDALGIQMFFGTFAGILGSLAVLWLANKTKTKRLFGF